MWNAFSTAVFLTYLLVPVATGIVTYARTRHRSFLQIPLVVAILPIAFSVLTVLLFSLDDGIAPRWAWHLLPFPITLLLIDAIRRLERSLT